MKRFILGCIIWSLTSAASAQWEASVGYSDIKFDNLNLGAVVAAVGYRIPVTDALSLAPALRVGSGITSETFPLRIGVSDNGQPDVVVTETKVEIHTLYGLQLQGRFNFDNGINVFIIPSYTTLKLDPGEFNDLQDDSGFGIGIGAGMRISKALSAEVSYETLDFSEAEVLSIQARLTF